MMAWRLLPPTWQSDTCSSTHPKDYEEQPGPFCLTRGLPAPIPLNLKSADSPQVPALFKQIVDMASKP
jgi:hypothetical protein